MPPDVELSDLQVAVMRVLWDRGEATAAEVQRALRRSRGLAITTVSTLLSRLEKRGLVAHREEGRAFVYRAAVSEPEVRKSMLGTLLRGLFAGDPTEVVSQLLASRDVGPDDLARIESLIDDAKRRAGRTRER